MIKNIQKYFLLNYPIVWNIKLMPVLLILICAHVIFFAIGYLATKTAFDEYYYYFSPGRDVGLAYFAAVLVGILILIAWLIFYNRNNAFKTFYPRTAGSLCLEWLLIVIITVLTTSLPVSLTSGCIAKWRSLTSYSEARKDMELIKKAKILMPSENYYYSYYSDYDQPIPVPNNGVMRIDTLDLDLFSLDYNNDNLVIKGYIGPSILFYTDSDSKHYSYGGAIDQQKAETAKKYKKNSEEVKNWLRQGNKDKIYELMSDFIRLHEKYGLKTNLDADSWFKRIYNPPYFAVDANSFISYAGGNDYCESTNSQYYFEYNKLESNYDHIIQSYENNETVNILLLICLCIAVMISAFIYSFRITKGKSWLIALVCSGVLMFISCLCAAGVQEISSGYNSGTNFIILFCLFWIVLFITFASIVIEKVASRQQKGYSTIIINIFLWLLPCIYPLLFFCYHSLAYSINDAERAQEEDIITMFWINIPVAIITMAIATLLIRKWKSLPEE